MLFVWLSSSLEKNLMNWHEPRNKGWLNARVIAWATFDIGTTIFSMVVISRYFAPWIVEQMHGSVFSLNATMSVSMLVSALLQVFLSPISDELGRRRIFVFTFTMFCIGACALMSSVSALTAALILFLIANIGYQSAFVFYSAMLGDVSDDRHRARISGLGIGLGYVGSILGLLVSEQVVDPKYHFYSEVFSITAALVLLFTLPLFLFVQEKRSFVRLNLAQSLQNSVGSFITTLRRIARHKEMLFFFIGCLLALDAVHTVTLNMSLYCKAVVGLDDVNPLKWKGHEVLPFPMSEMNLFLSVSAAFGILGAFLFGHIADKTSHYKTLLAVLILWMGVLIMAMFSVQRKLFWFTGPLFGLGYGGIWTVSRAYLLDLCHPEERGQMFAIYGLVSKGAAILGPLVWGVVFTQFQPVVGERKAYRLSIAAILILVSIGYWVLLQGSPRKAKTPSY